jgi:hypothetical protein
LGFDIENDINDPNVLEIAYEALKTPLPKTWRKCMVGENEALMYLNMREHTLHNISPVDLAALQSYEYYKQELENEKKSKKVVPKAKNLPPIGSKDKKKDDSKNKNKLPDLMDKDKNDIKDKDNKDNKGDKNKNKANKHKKDMNMTVSSNDLSSNSIIINGKFYN